MNEKLKLLAVKASILHKGCEPVGLQSDQLEKFAELIILECARIANEVDDTMTGQGEASAQAFKEHFGITR